jgi:hypothetical protein
MRRCDSTLTQRNGSNDSTRLKRMIIDDSRTGMKREKKNWQLFLYYEKTQAMNLAWLVRQTQ